MTVGLDRYRAERQQQMHARVTAALLALDAAGEAISLAQVARTAGVSRQWLYTSPFRDEILALRDAHSRSTTRPATARASERSLRAQNETLRQRLKETRAENDALRAELARALGRLRGEHTGVRDGQV